MLSYQITKSNDKSLSIPYEVEWFEASSISYGLCIHLHDNNNEGILRVDYDFKADKYEEKDIEDLHKRILFIVKQILDTPEIKLSDIEIVTPEEKNIILNEFNNTFLPYDENKTLIDYFEEQVAKTPNNIALVFHNKSITYDELNKKANSLARFLRNNRNNKQFYCGCYAKSFF